MPSLSLTVRSDHAAPFHVRDAIRGFVSADCPQSFVADACLVASELVSQIVATNVATETAQGRTIEVEGNLDDQRLRVEVAELESGPSGDARGRDNLGERIIERVASRHGADTRGGRSWFELDRPIFRSKAQY